MTKLLRFIIAGGMCCSDTDDFQSDDDLAKGKKRGVPI